MKISFVSFGFEKFAISAAKPVFDSSRKLIQSLKPNTHIIKDIIYSPEAYEKAIDELIEAKPDILIIQFATFCMGNEVLKLIEKMKDVQIILWGIREPSEALGAIQFNSFTALNMITSFLHKWERPYLALFGNPDEKNLKEELKGAILANKVKYALKNAKFCTIGSHPPGFYLSDLDKMRLRGTYGCEIIQLSELALLDKIDAINDETVKPFLDEMHKEAKLCASNDSLLLAAKFQKALEIFAKEENIKGFAIKCWPDLQAAKNFAPCSTLSRLNNKGLTCSCEADIPALISMFIMQHLSDKPVFLTDLVNVTADGLLDLWHCGPAPIALAASSCTAEYGEHPTMKNDIGVSANFPLMSGDATLLKFKENKDDYSLFTIDGKALEPEVPMKGSHVQFSPNTNVNEVISAIFDNGIEHHYCLAYGNHIVKNLEIFAKLTHMCLQKY